MIVTLDPNSLILQVKVGTLEKYKPSKEMKDLQKRVDKLKNKLSKFQLEMTPELEEIKKAIEGLNKPFIEAKKE